MLLKRIDPKQKNCSLQKYKKTNIMLRTLYLEQIPLDLEIQ